MEIHSDKNHMPKLHVNNMVKLTAGDACWFKCVLVIGTRRGYCCHKNTGAAKGLRDLQAY